jgi:hypothetical protein
VKFTSSCDIAKQQLAGSSVSYSNEVAPAGTPAVIKVGETWKSKPLSQPEDIAAAKDAAEEKLADLKAAEPVNEKAVKPPPRSLSRTCQMREKTKTRLSPPT